MGMFKKAEMNQAYVKAAFYGPAGSGKSMSAALFMAGLLKEIKSDKPLYFLDTETGSDWLVPLFEELGIEIWNAKTRAFKVLQEAIADAEKNGGALMVDSITHFWEEIQVAYQRTRKDGGKYVGFEDWAIIKRRWNQEWVNLFLNAKVHMVICGRQANNYEYVDNGKTNKDGSPKLDLVKGNTKMKAEKELEYEPGLLVEMDQLVEESGITIVAQVLKDRSRQVMGKKFYFPQDEEMSALSSEELVKNTYDKFIPHVQWLNIGGKHEGVDTEANSEEGFPPEYDGDEARSEKTKKEIAFEELKELSSSYLGKTKEEIKFKGDISQALFGTRSAKALQGRSSVVLEQGVKTLKAFYKLYEKSNDKKYFMDNVDHCLTLAAEEADRDGLEEPPDDHVSEPEEKPSDGDPGPSEAPGNLC